MYRYRKASLGMKNFRSPKEINFSQYKSIILPKPNNHIPIRELSIFSIYILDIIENIGTKQQKANTQFTLFFFGEKEVLINAHLGWVLNRHKLCKKSYLNYLILRLKSYEENYLHE